MVNPMHPSKCPARKLHLKFRSFLSILEQQQISQFIVRMHSHPTRLLINSTEQLTQLKDGHFSRFYTAVKIMDAAHANLTVDAILLANTAYSKIEINDKYGNQVELMGRTAAVVADIYTDIDMVCGLPDSYKVYTLYLKKTLRATDRTAKCILQWTKAGAINIHADNDVMYQLMAQAHGLNALSEVHDLAFLLDQSSFSKINVTDVMEHLPALQTIRLLAKPLDTQQIEAFVQKQGALAEWTVEVQAEYIRYNKKIQLAADDASQIWMDESGRALRRAF